MQKAPYWERWNQLHSQLSGKFYEVMRAVSEALKQTLRASSMVENLNSRLRNYFFLRRSLGDSYLSLLQFFCNHRRFLRSRVPERVSKSPRQLLTGDPHPHWLELLGFTRFQRAWKRMQLVLRAIWMMVYFVMRVLPQTGRN